MTFPDYPTMFWITTVLAIVLVGITHAFIMDVNLILIPYSYLGLLRVGNLTTILALSPLAFVGVRIGVFLNGRFTGKWLNRIIYTILFLTGIQLILGQNLLNLFLN